MTEKIISTILQQLNDLSATQIMLIEQIRELRERVAALEAGESPCGQGEGLVALERHQNDG
jgi:hypothetical protein